MNQPIQADRVARYVERINSEAATMEELCQRVAEGESLRAVCKAWDIPYARVAAWVAADEQRAAAYDAAKRFRADALADEVLSIADTPQPGVTRKEGPDGVTETTEDMLGHRRLQVDARLKLMSKWDKQRYGDGPQVAVSASITLNLTAEDTHVL